MDSQDSRLQSCTETMERVCKAYEQDENAQLLSLMLEGQRELERVGLGGPMWVHSLKTLVHPNNRGDSMLEIADIDALVQNITDVGFSWKEVDMAAAVKLPPIGSDARRRIEAKNEELVNSANGKLGKVVRDECDIAVLSCNHNTAGLKGINCKAKCNIDSISADGRYSMSKICEKCPSYTKPLTEGLRYFTMEACVEVRFPQFINLTIEACNVGSALAKPDTVLAICAKAHKIAMADIKAGKHVDTKAIVKKLGRAKPALAPNLVEIVDYAVDWAGGSPPIHLNSTLAFAKGLDEPNFGNLMKHLSVLNAVDMGKGVGGRHRRGCMKGLLLHAKFLNPGHLKQLAKESNARTLAFKTEAELVKFDATVSKMTKGKEMTSAVLHQVGLLEIDCVSYAHQLTKKFDAVNAIFEQHFDVIAKLTNSNMKNPYRAEPVAKVKGGGEIPWPRRATLGSTGILEHPAD